MNIAIELGQSVVPIVLSILPRNLIYRKDPSCNVTPWISRDVRVCKLSIESLISDASIDTSKCISINAYTREFQHLACVILSLSPTSRYDNNLDVSNDLNVWTNTFYLTYGILMSLTIHSVSSLCLACLLYY